MLPLALICGVILLQQATGKADVAFSTLSTSDPKIQEEIIDKLNEIRRHVEPTSGNMLKMAWNPEAARNARSWAEKCSLTTSPFKERTIKSYSCNELHFSSTSPELWRDVIDNWYSSVAEFQYGTRMRKATNFNQYSQMVVANSHQVGCAVASCPEGKFQYFYVCHFYPPMLSSSSQNVPYAKGAPCAECPESCDKGLCTDPCIFEDTFYSKCANHNEKKTNNIRTTVLKPNFTFLNHDPLTQMEIVNKHNELRRSTNPTGRNILKMAWNEEAAVNAEKWAKNCVISHSPGPKRKISFANCGENIYASTNFRTWPDVIQAFFDEVKYFKFGHRPTTEAKVLHYTQLVWATSHQLGCAMSHCPNQKMQYLYVCQYCPQGNSGDPYTPYKIGSPCSDCPHNCDNGLCRQSIVENLNKNALSSFHVTLTKGQKDNLFGTSYA